MGKTEKTYNVAGHTFCVVMDDSSFIWRKMEEPYGLFEVKDSCTTNIFNVELVDEIVRQESELVFSNKSIVEDGFIVLSVYKEKYGLYVEFTQPLSDRINGFLRIEDNWHNAYISLSGTELEMWLTFNACINFCYMLAVADKGTLLVHASSVIYDGKAYLFLGKSGTGKSTHAGLWLSEFAGAELLNDDHPVLRTDENGSVTAYGSPWSGKTHCYRNISMPVGGIVRIRRAKYNVARRLSMIEAYASLMTSCMGITWEKLLADEKDVVLQRIIAAVPCWVMECLPNRDAAIVCRNAIVGKV